jgi:hypothetical protein
MFGGFFESLRDSFRHRFGRREAVDEYRATADEERAALGRHNDAEARIVGRTLGESNELRAFGKGRPR